MQALQDGAEEIDMVLPVGMLKQAARGVDSGAAASYVVRDIAAVVSVCRRYGALCKVIFETCLLTPEERDLAVSICALAGADYVKTSTGFSKGGATAEDVGAMAGNAAMIGESRAQFFCH
jgi:deoxyribose-phosphate aldolase